MRPKISDVLADRYASTAMLNIWSTEAKIIMERQLWIAVLRAQKELGMNISQEAIKSYERVIDNVDLKSMRQRELKTRHDVKARIEEFNALAGYELVPTGYLNEKRSDRKGHVLIDPDRAPVIKQMFEKVAYEKWSGRKIYHWLKFDLNFKTSTGNKNLTLSNVFIILSNPFYYGEFEYPKKSELWYKGIHEPIISKELFDQVQDQMRKNVVRVESKEFAFTKLMKCGLCGSGITADEKFKKQKNGNIHRYVYYGCTKFNDKRCPCGYINEKELIGQFVELINGVDLDEAGIKNKLQKEVHRIKGFQMALLGKREKIVVGNIDIRGYAQYLLQNGTNTERRELLSCLKSRLTLKEKKIFLD